MFTNNRLLTHAIVDVDEAQKHFWEPWLDWLEMDNDAARCCTKVPTWLYKSPYFNIIQDHVEPLGMILVLYHQKKIFKDNLILSHQNLNGLETNGAILHQKNLISLICQTELI